MYAFDMEDRSLITNIGPSHRTVVSLLLFMHLFAVGSVLSGNFLPSPLQQRLAATFSQYTRTLHLTPNSLPFHLTDGEGGLTRLHQWQVAEKSTGTENVLLRLPNDQMRASFNYQRQDRFASLVGCFPIHRST